MTADDLDLDLIGPEFREMLIKDGAYWLWCMVGYAHNSGEDGLWL